MPGTKHQTMRPLLRLRLPRLPPRHHLSTLSTALPAVATSTRVFLKTLAYFTAANLCLLILAPIHGINGQSMSPTLGADPHKTDWIQFLPLPAGALTTIDDSDAATAAKDHGLRALRRGRLVLFRKPHDPASLAVKRVVGLPGDTITPVRKPAREGTIRTQPCEPTVVPFGHLWVEGDNPSRSLDSADYGPISLSLVQEVAFARVGWPWRWGWGTRKWKRVAWEEDGWEERLGVGPNGRLRRREESPGWQGETVPDAWRMFGPDGKG